MINDRGKIKWASLMLPEHVEMLQEFFLEDTLKEKPILSEEYINEMELTLHQAIQTNQKIKISYYMNSSLELVAGYVRKIHPIEKKITLQEATLQRQVPFENIVAIELFNDQ